MNAIPPFHSKTTPYQYLVKTNGFVLNMEITYEIPRVVPLPSLRTPRSAARSCHALHRRPRCRRTSSNGPLVLLRRVARGMQVFPPDDAIRVCLCVCACVCVSVSVCVCVCVCVC